MTEPTQDDWQARLAAQATFFLACRERRRADRAERQERRDAGLRARHAAKLNRQQHDHDQEQDTSA